MFSSPVAKTEFVWGGLSGISEWVASFLSGPWRPLSELKFASGESCTTETAKNNCSLSCCFTCESEGGRGSPWKIRFRWCVFKNCI